MRAGEQVRTAMAHRARDTEKDHGGFDLLFTSNPLPMWVYDVATLRFLEVNAAAAAQYGYSRDEFLGMRITDIRPPEDAARLLQEVATPRPSLQHSGEWRHRLKDGRLIDVTITSHTLSFDDREAVLVVAQDITDRKRAEAQVQRQLATLTALYEGAQRVSQSLDLPQLAREVVRTCVDSFAVRLAWIGEAEANAELTLLAHHPPDVDYPRQLVSQLNHSARWRGVTGRALRTGASMIVEDLTDPADPPPWQPAAAALGLRCAAIFPLVSRTHAFGVLCLYSDQPGFFTVERTEFFQAYTNQAAAALANARLYEQAGRRLQHVQALRDIDMAITSSLNRQVTLNVFLDKVTSELQVDAASVLLFNPHAGIFEMATKRGFRTPALQQTGLRLGEGHAGRAALERHLIAVPDLARDPGHFARDQQFAQEQFVAYYAVPLTAKGQVKGILEVFHRSPLRPDLAWLDFLDVLAGQAAIAIDSAGLFTDLQKANDGLSLAYDRTLEGWSRTLDLRDQATEGHTQRVAELTLRLARALHVAEPDLVHIRRGALLHDIGKMGVPDSILFKPGPLTEEEWEIMRRHPVYAHDLLSPIDYLRPALDIPYCHHEQWGGTGYPRKLKGEQIPLAARIFAVVDVWDALRSDRPYRPAWSEEQARRYIREQAGTRFDPRVVEAFLALEV